MFQEKTKGPQVEKSFEMPSRRYQLCLLHSLVSIVLCYQLVFSSGGEIGSVWKNLIAVGMLGTILVLFQLPVRLWSATWLTGALVLGDTFITSLVIYLAGHASSNLYMTFFLIILIAAFAPSFKQLVVLSLLLCSAYGLILYFQGEGHLLLSEERLLQLPVLLILGIFYGVTNQTARSLRDEKETLLHNISEVKEKEKALRASEKRYRNWIQLSPDGIVIIKDHTIDFLNDSGCHIIGAETSEQVIGKSPYEFMDPDDQAGIKEQIQQVLDGQDKVTYAEKQVRRLDGTTVDVELGATAITEREQVVVQLVLRDISERKQLENRFHQAQKMESIGLLAGGIAHDFNNMLTVINGHSEMLAEDEALTIEQRECIEPIQKAAQRATVLTSQLLAFSRRQVLQPKVLNLNSSISDIQQILRPLVGETIALHTDLTSDQVHVKVDPTQLEQVIINLTLNAREAMPEGGKLTISTRAAEIEPGQFQKELSGVPGGRYALLQISDTGIGMDPSTKAQIFEPFFTTRGKGKAKGSGLGLSTAYGIIKQSGGLIQVDSHVNEGATFSIYLPLAKEVIPETKSEETVGRSTGTETLLVVDDEAGVRSMVRDFLQNRGYDVLVAMDGEEALHVSDAFSGHIDLLLTDVIMPNLGGLEMSEKFLLKRPGTKIVFMSGYTDDEVFQNGIEATSMHFVQKPFSLPVLANKVRKVLDHPKSQVA